MRRAFTLVELLVVLFVVVAISAVAITIAIPATGERRMREAARGVNGFFLGAKARAADSGRPFGVLVEEDPSTPGVAFVLHYAEVPPPYSGDLLNSRATTTIVSASDGFLVMQIADIGWRGANQPDDLIQPGDLVRFDYQAHEYRIIAIRDRRRGLFDIAPRVTCPWPLRGRPPALPGWAVNQSVGVLNQRPALPRPYQVLRQPVRTQGSFEMPGNLVVDLTRSGVGATGRFGAGRSIAVMFSPTGAIDTINGARPPAAVFFMIGKRENVGGQFNSMATPDNLADPETLWVGVNHQTGLATTAENYGPGNARTLDQATANARRRVRSMQSMGGR